MRLRWTLLVVAALFAGCGKTDGTQTSGKASADAPAGRATEAKRPKPLVSTPPKAFAPPRASALGTLPEGIGIPVGERAPDVTVKDANGADVTLSSLVEKGKVLLFFYRGGW